MTDLQKTRSRFLASDKFRQVVETLEPDLHQFQPVELIWKDGSHAADFFWFNPCARVDGMDREHTTHEYNEKLDRWHETNAGHFVVNLAQVKGHHLWIDPRTYGGMIRVSEVFRDAMKTAGVVGINFSKREVV